MKKLLLVMFISLTPFFMNTAMADSCTAQMKNSNGQVIMDFTRYNNGGMNAACNDATYDCNSDLRYRQSYGEMNGGYCEVKRRGRQGYTCSYDLRSNRNSIIRIFRGRGLDQWNACRHAKSRCQADLNFRRSRGQNIYASCVRSSRGGGGGNRNRVTRFCRVDRVDIYNRLIQTYNRQATGPRQSGVKRQACQKAQRACEQNCWGNQRCMKIR